MKTTLTNRSRATDEPPGQSGHLRGRGDDSASAVVLGLVLIGIVLYAVLPGMELAVVAAQGAQPLSTVRTSRATTRPRRYRIVDINRVEQAGRWPGGTSGASTLYRRTLTPGR